MKLNNASFNRKSARLGPPQERANNVVFPLFFLLNNALVVPRSQLAMGQNPNRTPSERPNPITKIGSRMGGDFTHPNQNGISRLTVLTTASLTRRARLCSVLRFLRPITATDTRHGFPGGFRSRGGKSLTYLDGSARPTWIGSSLGEWMAQITQKVL